MSPGMPVDLRPWAALASRPGAPVAFLNAVARDDDAAPAQDKRR